MAIGLFIINILGLFIMWWLAYSWFPLDGPPTVNGRLLTKKEAWREGEGTKMERDVMPAISKSDELVEWRDGEKVIKCTSCGEPIPEFIVRCPTCGNRMDR